MKEGVLMRQRVILTCLVAIGLALSVVTPAFAAGVLVSALSHR